MVFFERTEVNALKGIRPQKANGHSSQHDAQGLPPLPKKETGTYNKSQAKQDKQQQPDAAEQVCRDSTRSRETNRKIDDDTHVLPPFLSLDKGHRQTAVPFRIFYYNLEDT